MDLNFPDVVLRPGVGRRCRVLFSYSPQNDDELQLQVNDEIDFLSEVEDGWWKGKLGNKIGVFPSNFVCELPTDESCASEGETSAPLSSPDSAMMTLTLDDAPVLPPKPIKETCRVLYAYDAANEDELTLKKDDIITIITKEVEDMGWWKGELRGKVGLFPDNFVELITPPEDIVHNQHKKPDRPIKSFEKPEPKVLLVPPNYFKILQDNTNHKNQTDKPLATDLKEGPLNKKNVQITDKSKPDLHGLKNLHSIKPDSFVSHRKSSETKTIENQPPTAVGKKPVLPPPLSSKLKPVTGKPPGQVKRLSEEMNDIIENSANKSVANMAKRLSGDQQDLVDGGSGSKIGCAVFPTATGGKEDIDLDIVERSDMLTHMTSSRPRPPGRRLPTKDTKEIEPHSPLTNGSVDTSDKEKNHKEREWEKHKPPWVNELKLNLKSNKTSPSESKYDRKSAHSGSSTPAAQSPEEVFVNMVPYETTTASYAATCTTTTNVTVRPFGGISGSSARLSYETGGSNFSDLLCKFGDKTKPITSSGTSPIRSNDVSEYHGAESVHITRKEFTELKNKMDKLEKMVLELTGQLREESDKRKLLENELNKLTDLVTQV